MDYAYQVRKIAGVSVRRVNQLWKQYNESGEVPLLKRTSFNLGFGVLCVEGCGVVGLIWLKFGFFC